MAKATRIDNAAAIAACDAIVDDLDAGAAPKFRIYSGTRPASPDAAVGTGASLLCELDLATPAVFGNASDASPGGQAAANGLPISNTSATGGTAAAAWFRATTGTGTGGVTSGTIGTGTDFDAVIDNTSIAAGQTVKLTAWTFTVPES